MEVKGWQIAQTAANGTVTRREVEGSLLAMTMPQCKKLDVTPILADASAIVAIDTKPCKWQWDGAALRISGVKSGTRIALYDLRGILISSTIANGTDVRINVGKGYRFILKVGEVSKIVCRQ